MILGLVGVLLHEGVGVLGEAARRGQKEPAVPRTLLQEALDELEREGQRLAHELRIVVRGVGRTALRQRVPQPVDGDLPDRAARLHDPEETEEDRERRRP